MNAVNPTGNQVSIYSVSCFIVIFFLKKNDIKKGRRKRIILCKKKIEIINQSNLIDRCRSHRRRQHCDNGWRTNLRTIQ